MISITFTLFWMLFLFQSSDKRTKKEMLTEPGMKAKMDNSQGTSDKDGLQTEA
jgi:hypothetical protein